MSDFLSNWDKEFENLNNDKKQLYEKLLDKFNLDGMNDVEQCWRLVNVCLALADVYEKAKNKNETKFYIEKAVEYAKKAIELDPNCMNAHKWYCAAVGRMAPFVGTKERIELGHKFKEHRDIAVKMDSNDVLMHHMYGQWCYEVASLSFLERKIAETFFATPPKASYEDALESFKMADALKHEWKMNHLWMAKAYIALKKYDLAMEWIDSGMALGTESEEDSISHTKMEALEKSYAKYRVKK